jgi:hypothetical protein
MLCRTWLLCLIAAGPAPADPDPAAKWPADQTTGPPKAEEQIRAALKDKGAITYAGGQYRLSARKVDGLDLIDLEFREVRGGKVVYRITSPRARVSAVDVKAGTFRLSFGEMKVVKGDDEIEARGQELDLPAPPRGK